MAETRSRSEVAIIALLHTARAVNRLAAVVGRLAAKHYSQEEDGEPEDIRDLLKDVRADLDKMLTALEAETNGKP
jgi:hypothetical protein